MPLAAVITILSVLIYAAVQQNYRQSLNDPQIQIAEDAAAALKKQIPVNQIIPVGDVETVDIAKSLSPWIAIYDSEGEPLLSTGALDGSMPTPPKGVFTTTRSTSASAALYAENRVTWQPQAGVREALVVVSIGRESLKGDPAYVVVGRNMREVEAREKNLSVMVFFAWLTAIVFSLLFKATEYYLFDIMKKHG